MCVDEEIEDVMVCVWVLEVIVCEGFVEMSVALKMLTG